jgi:hypothetical protein
VSGEGIHSRTNEFGTNRRMGRSYQRSRSLEAGILEVVTKEAGIIGAAGILELTDRGIRTDMNWD